MTRPLDLTGHKYNELTVLELSHRKKYRKFWLCLCSCGTETIVDGGNIRSGHTKSCGCKSSRHNVRFLAKTHGRSGTKEYFAWVNMKARCHNIKNPRYSDYGGRGIKVHQEWRDSFEAFLDHIGKCPDESLTLDRIDNDGNYEPNNVQWASRSEQNKNTRPNKRTARHKFRGELLTLKQISEITGINRNALHKRVTLGWEDEKLATPIGKYTSSASFCD